MKCRKYYNDNEKYKKYRNEYKKRYSKSSNSENTGCQYSDEEKILILEHSMPDRELSNRIGHSITQIQSYRAKMKQGKASLPVGY